MSVHEQLLDTTKSPEEAVPRENLDANEFKDRVESWRDYLADAVDGPKLKIEEHANHIKIHGNTVCKESEFNFSIPFERDIETAYGVANGCKLKRIDFYPKQSGEQFRAQYFVGELPEPKQNDSFATNEQTSNEIIVIYDAKTNTQKNVCLNQDQFGYSSKGSARMIPLFIGNRS